VDFCHAGRAFLFYWPSNRDLHSDCRTIARATTSLLVRIHRCVYRMSLHSIWYNSRHLYDYCALARVGESAIFTANINGEDYRAFNLRSAASRGILLTVSYLATSRRQLHKEKRTPPRHPSTPKNPGARTRNGAVHRESASPKTVPAA
jgi:hypothetical protein